MSLPTTVKAFLHLGGSPVAVTVVDRVDDTRLRRHRFRICERQAGKPAVWTRDGKRYTQAEAERVVRGEPEPGE